MYEVLFPKNINCIFCNMPIDRNNSYSICRKCFEKLEFIDEICICCGRSGKHSSLCTYCYSETYYYDRVYSILNYNEFIHKIMYGYKYGHKNYYSSYFAEVVNDFISRNELEFDYITSVPISKKRLNVRGFNQSEIIVNKISDKYLDLFKRTKHTKFLSKLTNVDRLNEVRGAFQLNQDIFDDLISEIYTKSIDKPKIIIFDDILTTGATLNELSKLLKKSISDVEIIALTLCNARNIEKYSNEKPTKNMN